MGPHLHEVQSAFRAQFKTFSFTTQPATHQACAKLACILDFDSFSMIQPSSTPYPPQSQAQSAPFCPRSIRWFLLFYCIHNASPAGVAEFCHVEFGSARGSFQKGSFCLSSVALCLLNIEVHMNLCPIPAAINLHATSVPPQISGGVYPYSPAHAYN